MLWMICETVLAADITVNFLVFFFFHYGNLNLTESISFATLFGGMISYPWNDFAFWFGCQETIVLKYYVIN